MRPATSVPRVVAWSVAIMLAWTLGASAQPYPHGTMQNGIGIVGGDVHHFDTSAGPDVCRNACAQHEACSGWEYLPPNVPGASGPVGHCWLKGPGYGNPVPSPTRISGFVDRTRVNQARPAAGTALNLVGRWRWPGGVNELAADGTCRSVNDNGEAYRCTWGAENRNGQALWVVRWQHGYIDAMRLSADGQRLDGQNNHGTRLTWGRLSGPPPAKPSAPSPAAPPPPAQTRPPVSAPPAPAPPAALPPANPRDQDCRVYASGAADQARNLSAAGCSLGGLSSDANALYRWCLGAETSAVNADIARRNALVEACSGQQALQATCRTYSLSALNQLEQARSLGCGFSETGTWSPDGDGHYRWCLAVTPATADRETAARTSALARCKATQESRARREGTCRSYAKDAATQARSVTAAGCSLGGLTADENTLYRWCLGVDGSAVNADIARRNALVEACSGQQAREATCRTYSLSALNQLEQARSLGCGFSETGTWSPDGDGHYRWCLAVTPATADRETAARTSALDECRRTREAVTRRETACRTYAKTVADQARAMLAKGCALEGLARDEAPLYQWCLAAPDRATVDADVERRNGLWRTCERETSCRTYAGAALTQVQQAKRQGCGFAETGTWSVDRDSHYRWCLAVDQTATDREAVRRATALLACERAMDARRAKEAACREYAAAAAQQVRNAAARGCGFTGSAWSSDVSAHVKWCMAVDEKALADGARERDTALAECTATKAREAACRDYAKAALAQVQRASSIGCGFPPTGIWNPDSDAQVKWCLTVDEKAEAAGARQRDTALADCAATKAREAECRDYAKTVLVQVQRASTVGCGFQPTGLWNPDSIAHVKWCLSVDRAATDRETSRRAAELRECEAAQAARVPHDVAPSDPAPRPPASPAGTGPLSAPPAAVGTPTAPLAPATAPAPGPGRGAGSTSGGAEPGGTGSPVNQGIGGPMTAARALDALKMSVRLTRQDTSVDLDGDGRVTANDARLILMKVVGK